MSYVQSIYSIYTYIVVIGSFQLDLVTNWESNDDFAGILFPRYLIVLDPTG